MDKVQARSPLFKMDKVQMRPCHRPCLDFVHLIPVLISMGNKMDRTLSRQGRMRSAFWTLSIFTGFSMGHLGKKWTESRQGRIWILSISFGDKMDKVQTGSINGTFKKEMDKVQTRSPHETACGLVWTLSISFRNKMDKVQTGSINGK